MRVLLHPGKTLIFLAMLFLLAFTAPAVYADHPHEDDAKRQANDPPIPRDPDNQLPICEEQDAGGVYESLNGQIWVCVFDDPGIPGIPPVPAWENVPEHPGGGDVAQARRWDPVTIPGYSNVYSRFHPRTEWINPNPAAGNCPNVPGGCKLYGGADIELYRNGQPFSLHRTWFNKAQQVYTYEASTNTWVKRHDTGWQMGSATGPTYLTEMVGTWAYGTAPYGAKYYFIRGQERFWNGSAWAPAVVQDPKTSTGALDYVWDPPPGYTGKKPKKPKKAPPVENVKEQPSFIQPAPVSPQEDADNTPSGSATSGVTP